MITPTQTIRAIDLDTDEQNELDALLMQWAQKLRRNAIRSAYYDGKHAARDLGGNLTPPHLRRLSLVLGWSAKAVDHLNRRCKLESFAGGPADLPVSAIYDENWLGSEASQSGVASLIHGTSFLVTTVGDTTAGEPEALITGREALSGTGLWDSRARRLRSFVSINATNDDGEPTDVTYYRPNVILAMTKANGKWNVDRRGHRWGVPVEPLVYKPRLGRPFGSSRISRPVMSLHNQALSTVLRSEVTAELYQLPQRVLLGGDESAFIGADGSVSTAWQTVMGLVWGVPDDDQSATPRADIKQLPGAPQEPYIAQLRMQAQLFAGETSIPISSLGITSDGNPTSADAYIASREDLIAEAEGTVAGWTPAWKRAMLTACAIREGVTDVPIEWLQVEPLWRSPVFTSRASAADAGVKQLSIVPWLAETEVGLELLGLDPSQIKRALSERRRAEGRVAARARLAPTPPVAPEGEVSGDVNPVSAP